MRHAKKEVCSSLMKATDKKNTDKKNADRKNADTKNTDKKTDISGQEYSFDDHTLWKRNAGQASGGKRTKEKWERILAYTSQNKTGTQSRAGSQTNSRQEELDEIYRSKYDYRKFLKQFCRLREEVELDTESFDYIFYHFGMEHYGNLPIDRAVGI